MEIKRRVIIAGSRDIIDYDTVKQAIEKSAFKIDEVVCGGARGVDTLGAEWAEKNNVPVKMFPADWKRFGRGAGHIRNAEMAKYANTLIAIWDGKSKGTGGMIKLANKHNLQLFVTMVK